MMTYYGDSGEFHFEFGLDNCGANFGGFGGVPGTDGQGNCFFDIDAFSNYGEDSGHWDVNWEGAANACYPGSTDSTCANAPTNNFELDAHFGGPIAISGLEGAGNLVFVYDATSNNWMVSSTGTGIDAVLDSNFPDVNSMATFTSNIITPVGPTPVTTNIGGVSSGNGGLISTQTVVVGDVARIGYDYGYCCSNEHALSIVDTSTGAIYTAGDTYYAGWAPNVPSAYNTNTCNGASCYFTDGSWSTGWSTTQSNIPSSGVLPAGTYEIYMWDTYGDGSDGARLVWQTIAASAGFSSAPAGPYESNLFNGRSNGNTAYQA
jgi:hypothetical protein